MSGGGQIHCRGQATSGDLASAALTVTCGTAMSWCSCTAAAMALTMRVSQTSVFAVRPEGAFHQWREVPPRELSIALVADERFGWVTDWIEAS
jgi:hypothetical protein